MDSSSRVAFVLGHSHVKTSKLTPEERVTILRHILIDEHFGKMSGFKPLKAMAEYKKGDYNRRFFNAKLLEGKGESPELNASAHFAHLTHLATEDSGMKLPELNREFCKESVLLLSRKGRIVLWVTDWRCEYKTGLGFRSHREGTHETAIASSLTVLGGVGDKQLLDLLKTYPEAWMWTLCSLRKMVRVTIRQRAGYLRGMEMVHANLTGIMQRLDMV